MSESSPAKSKTPLLSDKTYDVLKHVVTIVLPGLATLYFALAQVWGLPKAEEMVGSIAAVNAFLGLLIGVSTRVYNNSFVQYDGVLEIGGAGDASIQLHHESTEAVANQQYVVFKVEKNN